MMSDLATRRRVRYAHGYLELGMLREAAGELDAIETAHAALPEVRCARVDLYMEAKEWEQVVAVGSAGTGPMSDMVSAKAA